MMGEFDIDRIVDLLDSGEFLWSDLYWHQGMSGWLALANLQPEIVASKSFPTVAAIPSPQVSGRRRMQTIPKAATHTTASSRTPGWWWILGGVLVGALVGLLCAHLFPKVVEVDRPVEKVVEKPVEVVRTIERRVDVPVSLTKEQQEAIDYVKERDDAYLREVGIGATAMVPVMEKKIKLFVEMDDVLKQSISEESIRARVEGAFRRNGFEVVDPKDKSVFCNTRLTAEIFRADDKSTTQIAGVIRLKVAQYYIASGANVQKLVWFDVKKYESALMFGSNNYYKLPAHFEDYAVQAANDLSKAGKLPYRKDAK
jgi:hypothetical protein